MAKYTVTITLEVDAESEDEALEEAAFEIAFWDSEDVIAHGVASTGDFDI